jgi:hypothetical protein
MRGIYKHSESGLVKKEHVMEHKGFEILPQKQQLSHGNVKYVLH